MDIGSFIGAASGLACIIISIWWGGGDIMLFFDMPSIFCVVGGTIASTLINYNLSDVFKIIVVVKNAFFTKSLSPTEVIAQIVDFSLIARRQGILMLEDKLENLNDDFFKKGFRLAIDGTAPEAIRAIMNTDLSYMQDRHRLGREVLMTMGTFAPAFGMCGTLIGLVIMLKNLSSPETIGPSMAVALITTFYGAVIANIMCLPIAGKLKNRSDEETVVKTLIIEGILSIQSGDNPRLVEEKMKAFLSPSVRSTLEKK